MRTGRGSIRISRGSSSQSCDVAGWLGAHKEVGYEFLSKRWEGAAGEGGAS